MEITAKMVKELRDKTNAGMMDCKKALIATGGDMEKARDWLRENGLATVNKRSGRIAKEGVVASAISEDLKRGAIVEFNTETDFVAKLDSFKKLADNIAKSLVMHEECPADIDGLLASKCPECGTVFAELINENTATTGEKSEIRRFEVMSTEGNAFVHSYNHAGHKLASLVALEVEKPGNTAAEAEVAHGIAMQVAATNPLVISREDLPPEAIERERKVFTEVAKNSGKPEKIWDKIIDGNFNKYYKEVVLLEQDHIKETSYTVQSWLNTFKESLGKIKIISFVRYQLAEEVLISDNQQ
ncbi:MAG: translation elongation factor Ts [Deltaproteobacteria bacterium]|jgi:elongation factor Ts|nr:translation elongation factor Ts [Deltaproteobacteria bacterium]